MASASPSFQTMCLRLPPYVPAYTPPSDGYIDTSSRPLICRSIPQRIRLEREALLSKKNMTGVSTLR
jgi:hypothetical protein